ncbi:hypothetical protein Z517_05459 [Fonsecaea pedrosoi CBS 271.37]|uniref:Unplaced genomic scaffold supercont1.3, whole genome shotgun sequence n=1 Tax=Fonsecaea pedrosoi CBS 271.37 TaxID=1442368 RepID=A0A0D2F768_9EURO|nr:uncharacterized protein Z517_05459 [Fonsecaea pedrosoi CBS 271.37]KIW82432.1 hypothetical protein Z517_05459 [Fonsecaea pedrosoi CBS 271.37]
MPTIFPNNLYRLRQAGSVCKAFGIKLTPSASVVQIAASAGFDTLFIDLEHSTLSVSDASQLCTTGLLAGITPFVRVPYQCGDGFVQKVLDGGAMGVIFPHVSTRAEAESAVSISKYPPVGKRSMTGQLPQFAYAAQPHSVVISESNELGSTVIVMIETQEALENLDAIASVPGVDVLLVGSNDLSIELGIPSQFDSPVYKAAMEKVSQACKKHGKIMGLGGVYDNPTIHGWALHELGVGYILGGQDSSFIAKSAKACADALVKVEKKQS